MAEVYIIGRADQWISSLDIPTDNLSWPDFCTMVCQRFAIKSNVEITDTFRNLKQYGSVDSYIDKFEELVPLVKRNKPHLNEEYFLEYFISGLKDHIKRPLKSLTIYSLVQAYEHARNYDIPSSHPRQYTNTGQSTQKTAFVLAKRDTPAQEHKVTTGTQSKGGGKCFRCQEPWVPGHGRVCKINKQLYLVTMEEDEALQEDPEESGEPVYSTPPDSPNHTPLHEVSMHALNGPHAGITTFTLQVKLGSLLLTALLDSGGTITFLSPKVVHKARLDIVNHDPIQVTVANGGILVTEAQCIRRPCSQLSALNFPLPSLQ